MNQAKGREERALGREAGGRGTTRLSGIGGGTGRQGGGIWTGNRLARRGGLIFRFSGRWAGLDGVGLSFAWSGGAAGRVKVSFRLLLFLENGKGQLELLPGLGTMCRLLEAKVERFVHVARQGPAEIHLVSRFPPSGKSVLKRFSGLWIFVYLFQDLCERLVLRRALVI